MNQSFGESIEKNNSRNIDGKKRKLIRRAYRVTHLRQVFRQHMNNDGGERMKLRKQNLYLT